MNIAYYPEDRSFAIFVSVQVVEDRDREALETIIASFQVAGVEGQVVTEETRTPAPTNNTTAQ